MLVSACASNRFGYIGYLTRLCQKFSSILDTVQTATAETPAVNTSLNT